MRSGRDPKPFISQASVRSALDSMLYTSGPQLPNSLEALCLVDQFLSNPDLPPASLHREFAVSHLLTSMVIHEYAIQRRNLGVDLPVRDGTLADAKAVLSSDAREQSPELMGWSLLYHRYVRVDLDLSSELISSVTYFDERTLRRYQNHAIKRLTDNLIRAEWDERVNQRKRRLYAALPVVVSIPLIGRDPNFQQVRENLSGVAPYHFQITGPPGIGKTVFVQETLRQQIDNGQIDNLIWIDNPESIEFIRQYLNEALLTDLTIGLKEYTLLHNLAIVLDNLECTVAACVEALQKLLQELSAASLYLTSRIYIPLVNNIKHIALRELNRQEATAFFYITGGNQSTDGKNDSTAIWDKVGGNPAALKLAAHDAGFYGYTLDFVSTDILDSIFYRFYSMLDVETKRCWLMFALFPPGDVAIEDLSSLWSSWIQQDAVNLLLRSHLLEPSAFPGKYVLPNSARHFIRNQYKNNADTRGLVDSLIQIIERQLSPDSPLILRLVEHILFANWPEQNQERRQKWITVSLNNGLGQGNYAHWAAILRGYLQDYGYVDIDLQVAYGACLRRLSEWVEAEHILVDVVSAAGHLGLFREQGRALLELGILFRQHGQYEKALRFLTRAESAARTYSNQEFYGAVQVERAQIAVDTKDAHYAESLLLDLPRSGRVLALRSELCLLKGDLGKSFELAQQAVALHENNKVAIGRLYAIMGQIYERQKHFDNAQYYSLLALTLLERENDLFALARTQCNLGALLVEFSDNYSEAHELLTRAAQVQTHLMDRVGLAATRHNLKILHQHFAD